MSKNKSCLLFALYLFLFSVVCYGQSQPLTSGIAYSRQLRDNSAINGIGREEVTILNRLPGPGRDNVFDELLNRFNENEDGIYTSHNYEIINDSGNIIVAGSIKGWNLSVSEDGSSVSYRNYEYRNTIAGQFNNQLTENYQVLENKGKTFILTKLKGLISIGDNDLIIPSGLQLERLVYELPNEKREEKVAGCAVFYSREVEGIPIIGPGSKIAVFFTSDGTPYGFEYDWPEYQTTMIIVSVLDIAGITNRNKRYYDSVLNGDSDSILTDMIECGYFDEGHEFLEEENLLQPACIYYSHSINKNGFSRAIAIPAGELVIENPSWPQSR